MSIADDLKSLQDQRDKGQLTEADYAAAKTKLLGEQQPLPNEVAPGSRGLFRTASVTTIVGLLVTAAAVGFGVAWYNTPTQLMDEVQSVPANAFEAIPFTLPYGGSVAINVDVVHGNPMDVLVIAPEQLANLQADNGQTVPEYKDFGALKTQVYERSARLQRGNYYLIVRDTSLGIPSAIASDITVRIQLKH